MIIVKTRWHVPQMRPDFTDPVVWAWWGSRWRLVWVRDKLYPNSLTDPVEFWCYEDPGGAWEPSDDDVTASWNYLDTETGQTTIYYPPPR